MVDIPVWTLWLITYGSLVGQGSGTVVVTPMSSFQYQNDCLTAIQALTAGLNQTYGKKNTPVPGVFFCVFGVPVKR